MLAEMLSEKSSALYVCVDNITGLYELEELRTGFRIEAGAEFQHLLEHARSNSVELSP